MPKKAIQLSDHFTYSRLLRFVLPCIGTMLFTNGDTRLSAGDTLVLSALSVAPVTGLALFYIEPF